jgi:alkanesulfonate monooxygenase SsuD/methylene tetrahydromethanopterin reductase-like flavin-dependent oxidoreductase (luciferase family)
MVTLLRVQISMTVPTMLALDRLTLQEWCAAIDEGPFASLAVPERAAWGGEACLSTLAACAAWTERVRLVTTIIVLLAHSAVQVAKELASADIISGGRVTAGVGVGGREQDYTAVGASFARRWQRLDDQVAQLRVVWRGEFAVDGITVGPQPVQQHLPLLAGALGPKATARAARWADGITGAWGIDGDMSPLAPALDAVRQAWKDADRTTEPHLSTSLWFALGDGAEETLKAYVTSYLSVFGAGVGEYAAGMQRGHDPGVLREAVAAASAAGCDELFLVPVSTDRRILDDVVRELDL